MEIGMEAERDARSVIGSDRNPQFHSYGSKPDRLVLGLPRHLAERSGNFCYDWAVELKGKWERGSEGKQVGVVAGVDVGGTAVNYTLVDEQEKFLVEGLCEHPSLAKQGPEICLQQIADGLKIAADRAGVQMADVVAVGLDTPGPASAAGLLSARGSTNFVHANWASFDIREGLAHKLGKPVSYLNDANAAALWGHYAIFGATSQETSISIIVGTGNGGGIILDGNVVKGKNGFGGELGHVLIPYQSIAGTKGIGAQCNCGRVGDLESLCSLTAIERNLLPYFLPKYPGHELGKMDAHQAAKQVRGLADKGDALCREIFRVQAHALGLFFDEMVNTFDPDALIVGGGALEASVNFQKWFMDEIRTGMPEQREEQAGIPIYVIPNGDTAGARGAAIEALKLARQSGLM
ncbi:MAG TPA: ROK family protein [Candidatus Acidoferrum sp.]|jgi:predicted NBD/HSP70 family sugar kinase